MRATDPRNLCALAGARLARMTLDEKIGQLLCRDVPAGTVRMVGHLAFRCWNSALAEARNLVITTFGNPYLADQTPSARTMLLMFDSSPDTQRSAVAVWLGEKEAAGRSPAALDGASSFD